MISLMDISNYMPYDMEYYMRSLYAICMFMWTVLFAEFAARGSRLTTNIFRLLAAAAFSKIGCRPPSRPHFLCTIDCIERIFACMFLGYVILL